MTDNLFKPTDSLTDAKVKTSVSLLDKLKQVKSNSKHTLLIDLSASMHEYMPSGKSKRETVKEIVSKLPAELKKYAFSNYCELIEGNHFPEMGGSTKLAEAFDRVKQDGIKEIILLTDGYPDNERSALAAADGLKIEIIYIGPPPPPKFLDNLAKGHKGQFITVDMIKANAGLELENKIKGLLGNGY
jgi:hypothetical protein